MLIVFIFNGNFSIFHNEHFFELYVQVKPCKQANFHRQCVLNRKQHCTFLMTKTSVTFFNLKRFFFVLTSHEFYSNYPLFRPQ